MGFRDRELGPLIAERRLHLRRAPRRTVIVSLGKPRTTKDSEEWECPFRIAGAGIRLLEYGRGLDAFQALTTALDGIRYFLDKTGTPLAWTGVFEDQTGFQRLIPLMPDAVDTRRMERLIEDEARRWANRWKRRHLAHVRLKKARQPTAPSTRRVRTQP
jgi:hypothetical protein